MEDIEIAKMIAYEILIIGIPYTRNENLLRYFNSIYNFICFEIEVARNSNAVVVRDDGAGNSLCILPRLQKIFRLDRSSNSVGSILVRFKLTSDKQCFLDKFYVFQQLGKTLTLSTINFIADAGYGRRPNLQSKVFVTENLPKTTYEIVMKLNALLNRQLIKNLWVTRDNFLVFILTNEMDIFLMNSCEDVENFVRDLYSKLTAGDTGGSPSNNNDSGVDPSSTTDATVTTATTTRSPIVPTYKLKYEDTGSTGAIPMACVKSPGDGVGVVPFTATTTTAKKTVPPVASTSNLQPMTCAIKNLPKLIYGIVVQVRILLIHHLIKNFWLRPHDSQVFILTNENDILLMSSCDDVENFVRDFNLRLPAGDAGGSWRSNMTGGSWRSNIVGDSWRSNNNSGVVPSSTTDATITTATTTRSPIVSTYKLKYGAAGSTGAIPKVCVKSTGDGVGVVPNTETETSKKTVVPIASTPNLQSIILPKEKLLKKLTYEIAFKLNILRKKKLIKKFWIEKSDSNVFIVTNDNKKLVMNSYDEVENFVRDLSGCNAGGNWSSIIAGNKSGNDNASGVVSVTATTTTKTAVVPIANANGKYLSGDDGSVNSAADVDHSTTKPSVGTSTVAKPDSKIKF